MAIIHYVDRDDPQSALDEIVKMRLDGWYIYHMWLAALYSEVGNIPLANREARAIIDNNPDFDLRKLKETYNLNDQYTDKMRLSLLNAGLVCEDGARCRVLPLTGVGPTQHPESQ